MRKLRKISAALAGSALALLLPMAALASTIGTDITTAGLTASGSVDFSDSDADTLDIGDANDTVTVLGNISLTDSDWSITAAGNAYFATASVGGSSITAAKIANWDTAYGWGNHAVAGYLSGSSNLSDVSNPNTALNNLLPTQTGNSGKALVTNATNAAWTTIDKAFIGLGNVENTALTGWAGSSSITTLGTIGTGTWNGSAIGVAYGGTGLSAYTAGDMLYASGASTLAKLAKGTDGQVLTLGSGVPTWAALPVVTADRLQSTPTDLGAAPVSIDLSNSNAVGGTWDTDLTIDGIFTAGGINLTNNPTHINGVNGNNILRMADVPSGENFLAVTNAASGSGPTMAVVTSGSDTDVDLNLSAMGTGSIHLNGGIGSSGCTLDGSGNLACTGSLQTTQLVAPTSGASLNIGVTNASSIMIGQTTVGIDVPGGITTNGDLVLGPSSFVMHSWSNKTAYNGGTQGPATLITEEVTIVNSATQDNDSIKLPLAQDGQVLYITNISGSIIELFSTSGNLLNGSGTAAVSIPVNGAVICVGASNSWNCVQ